MLNTLRQSEKCEKGILFIGQSLFADAVTALNTFYPLSSDGRDNIAALSHANYKPAGFTALYDAVLTMVKEFEAQMEYAREQGFRGSACIAVITNGEENKSTATAAQVKAAITCLHDREWLENSLIIGLADPEFTQQMMESLREAIGFKHVFRLLPDPKSIRRAFMMHARPVI